MNRAILLVAALLPVLVAPSPATALAKNGEGLCGLTPDLVITNFGMALGPVFAVLVFSTVGDS